MLAAIAALVVGYVPLTGLDHLHHHIDHGLEFFHDRLHIGHHDHGGPDEHPADPREEHDDGDPGDESESGSAVVSLGQSAQVQPPAVEIDDSASPTVGHTQLRVVRAFDQPLHPSWDSRAPPC